jgi:RNase P subunit RPR2
MLDRNDALDSLLGVLRFLRFMKAQPEVTPEQRQRWETRAPGWQIRCLKCGFTEPFGKYGIRKFAGGKSYTVGFCTHCRWLRFYVIEKRPNA